MVSPDAVSTPRAPSRTAATPLATLASAAGRDGGEGAAVVPVLAGLAAAFPPAVDQSTLWTDFFAQHYRDVRGAGRIFAHAGVQRRHAAVNPLVEDISPAGTGDRMRRYLTEALPLGRSAVTAALADAGLSVHDPGLLAVVSCTGYVTPGVDIRLAADLGLRDDVQRLLIGHMGCYAALPGLATVADFVTVHRRPAVLLCVELTSLHLQPATRDLSQVVAHALFSDAAVAAVLRPAEATQPVPGLAVVDVAAVTDVTTSDQMTWDVTDHGFRMGLSARVPDTLAGQLPGTVATLLRRHGLSVADVAHWAVHPGGPRILDVVQERLGLSDAALEPSRATLREHGNCSSGTVLAVLQELPVRLGERTVALAFGPGLTLYAVLLRAV
ncbi:type III polyketide synthase [Actinocatenispora sera]|uniref:Naringenin-chalcone synthase n=1 Tax=Actinocatenispora sera TaxID=390989 RepID=A0A810KZZ7_9ACTN|nr:type III polyketide synthase [Actinocatenispora sera]BCJ27781.1 naringenin-chalcone synthase [Actinocatenispora sera]